MSQLSIRLEGYPEKVQRIADTLDSAFPDMLAWEPSEDPTDGATIKIEGLEKPLPPVQAPQTNPTTKLRPAALPWHTAGDASVVRVTTDRRMLSLARRESETVRAAVAPLGGNKRGVAIAISALHTTAEGREGEIAAFIADEIAITLSRIRGVSVVSCAWPGGLAGEVTADFKLEGSLQRHGSRLRIAVKLVDALSKVVCWSATYDYEHEDPFHIQRDVAVLVAAGLEPELPSISAERMSRMGREGNSAYLLLLRAIPLIQLLDRRSFIEARRLLALVIEAEPGFSSAYSWLALWHVFLVGQGWAGNPAASIARAGEVAEHAVMLDPNDARGLTIAGHVRAFLHRRLDEALPLHERALALNPSLPLAWHLSGVAQAYAGNLDEAQRRIAHSRHLAPRDPYCFFADGAAIIVKLLSGEHEAATDIGRSVTQLNPRFSAAYKPYLAALGHLNKDEEAVSVRHRLLQLEPSFTVRGFHNSAPFVRRDHLEHYTSGLTMAGAL